MYGDVRERMGRLARLIDERVGWAVLALLLQPVILLLLNPGALTPDPYARCYDPWIYFGFATNPEQLEVLKTTYCSTRLPAILPYWACYKVFTPWWAHLLSHLGFYYAVTLSLYAVVARHAGRRGGLLAAALLGCNVWFLRTASWYLHDLPAMAYLMLALWMLTRSVTSRRWWGWMLAAGVACAAMLYSNLFWCNFGLGLAAYHWWLDRSHGNRRWWLKAVVLALGFAAATGGMAAFYGIGYGNLLFLEPMLGFMRRMSTVQIVQKAPTNDWIWSATWVMPAPVALGAWMVTLLTRLWRREAAPWSGFLTACGLAFALPAAALVVWEIKGIPWIQVDYYGTTLLPVSFLLLGAALAPALERLRPWAFALALTLTLVALMVPLRDTILPHVWPYACRVQPAYFLAAALAGAALIVLFPRRAVAACVGGVLLCGFNLSSLPTSNNAGPNAVALEFGNRTRTKTNGFRCVCSSAAWLKRVDPHCETLCWYSRAEPLGHVFEAMMCTRLWWNKRVSEKFPLIIDDSARHDTPLRVGDRVVIMTGDDDAFQIAQSIVAKRGWSLRVIEDAQIKHGQLSYLMVLAEVVEGPQPDTAPARPQTAGGEPPAQLTHVPADLANHARRHGGISPDGWLEKEARCILLASECDDELTLSGHVPFADAAPDFRTTAILRIDGEVVGERQLLNGTFGLRLPLGYVRPGPHLVEMRFSDTHQLSPTDARQMAMRLTRVGFASSGTDRPLLEQVLLGVGEYAGIDHDGWLAPRASCLLPRPGGAACLVVEGEMPADGEMELVVGAGEEVRLQLKAGPVSLRLPIGGEAGPCPVSLRFSNRQRHPDGRWVSFRVTKLTLESDEP